jgi:predicted Zn-dependent protease
MKRKVLIIALTLSILTGCSKDEESNLSYEGKIALENKEYEVAIELLSQALEEDSLDETSRIMYMQALKMKNALKYEEDKNYSKAIKELEDIEDLRGGSSKIKSDASKKKDELEKLYNEQQTAKQKRKEDAKYVAKQDKYKLNQEAIEIEKKKQEELEKEKEEEALIEDEIIEENIQPQILD